MPNRGFYGNDIDITKTAVAQFQQKYRNEILAPYGLKNGSGNAGNSTRDELNRILAGK